MGIATNANAFLLTIKAVAMGPVIGKGSKIGPGWWRVTLSSLPLPQLETKDAKNLLTPPIFLYDYKIEFTEIDLIP